MTITVEATYENGTLRLANSLPLPEKAKVRVTIHNPTPDAVERVRATSGLLGWTGDGEIVERVALDPEFGILESKPFPP